MYRRRNHVHQPRSATPFPVLALLIALTILGCSPQSTVANSNHSDSTRSQSSQIVVRFKTIYPALAEADCAAAYVLLAGAQKGLAAVVVRQIFSGAHVVQLQPSQSPSNTLAFAQYLSQQQTVDYAELDSTQQIKPDTSGTSKPALGSAPAVMPKTTSPGVAPVTSLDQAKFRSVCGSDVAMPS